MKVSVGQALKKLVDYAHYANYLVVGLLLFGLLLFLFVVITIGGQILAHFYISIQ